MNRLLTLLLILTPLYASPQQWEQLGPIAFPDDEANTGRLSAVGLGRYQVIEIHPKDTNTLYAGSCAGGIYKTTDGGKNWENINNGIISQGVNDIAIDPNKPDMLYIATGTSCFEHGFGVGVLMSKNGGKTWRETGLKFEPKQKEIVERVVIHPKNSKKLIAATRTAIYISEDRGNTWQKGLEDKDELFMDIELMPANANHYIVSGRKMYISKNSGASWEVFTHRLSAYKDKPNPDAKNIKTRRIEVATDPNNPKRLVIVYHNDKDWIDEVFYPKYTVNNIKMGSFFNRADENHMEVELDRKGNIYVGCVRVMKYNEGMPTTVSHPYIGHKQYMHDDVKELKIVRLKNRDILYAAVDGGIHKSSNGGETWQNISGKGLDGVLFYGLHQFNGKLVGGTQDNSSYMYENGAWRHMSKMYCDGGNAWILNNGYILAGCNSKLYGSDDNGMSWDYIHPSGESYGYDFDIEVVADTVVFLNTKSEVWRGVMQPDYKIKWQRLKKGYNLSHGIMQMMVSETDPNIIVIADEEPTWNPKMMRNKLWITRDGGSTWKDLTNSLGILAWKDIEDIYIDPYNNNRIWVCMGGFDDNPIYNQYVYVTEDGGKNWTNISEGIPNMTTNCITMYDGIEETLFVGTHTGVFYRNNLSGKWVTLGYGLPFCIITDIEIDIESKTVYVASFGRGVWKCDISKF